MALGTQRKRNRTIVPCHSSWACPSKAGTPVKIGDTIQDIGIDGYGMHYYQFTPVMNQTITVTSTAASQTPDYSFIKGRVWGDHEIVKTYNPTYFNHSYYSFGDDLVLPADPIREGYTFLGWFYSDGTQAHNGDFIDFEGEITLIAHWEAIA